LCLRIIDKSFLVPVLFIIFFCCQVKKFFYKDLTVAPDAGCSVAVFFFLCLRVQVKKIYLSYSRAGRPSATVSYADSDDIFLWDACVHQNKGEPAIGSPCI